MTEDEKSKLRVAKQTVTASLAAIVVSRYMLGQVDSRIETYVREVIDRPYAHNVYEQLAVGRFFAMCDRYGINGTEVQRFFTFYENLYLPGIKGKQRYKLTPVQAFQYASIYGFWDNGRRVVRDVLLYVPRKFSKTTSSASFVIYDLLYGDANAEGYIGANSHDQAKKCFDVIRGCMRSLDPHGRRYTVNEQMIKSRRSDRSAFAQCLTANARTKDGLNASTVVMDEFSKARDSELLTVLTTSMGVRENPLTVIITTASDVFDGPFYERLQGYKSLLLGEHEDDSVFAHIFEPDVDDAEDSELTWCKVHPHIGVTVSLDFYRREYRKAVRDGAEQMLAFRTKLLNVYAENEKRSWISATLAREIARPITLKKIKGNPYAMAAIDLSESDDFSAISFCIYENKKENYLFHTSYFFPRGALPGHPNEKLYRAWAEKGYLTLTEGDVIDYRVISDYIIGLTDRMVLIGVGYDPYKSREMINTLAAAGLNDILKPISQTYGNFTAPVECFEHGVKTGHIFINDNPINYFCFGNAVLAYDRLDNCKPEKRQQSQKIDGVITKLMCIRQYLDYEW